MGRHCAGLRAAWASRGHALLRLVPRHDREEEALRGCPAQAACGLAGEGGKSGYNTGGT